MSQTTRHQLQRHPKLRRLMSLRKLERTRRMTLQKLPRTKRTKKKAKMTSPLSRPKSSRVQKARPMLLRQRPKTMRRRPRKLDRAIQDTWMEKIERQKPFAIACGPLHSLLALLTPLIVTAADVAGHASSIDDRFRAHWPISMTIHQASFEI